MDDVGGTFATANEVRMIAYATNMCALVRFTDD